MTPKKQAIEAAKTDGTIDKAGLDISAAYLLVNVAVDLYMEAHLNLRSHGLLIGDSLRLANRLQAAFDNYIMDFGLFVRRSGNEMTFAKDFDELRPALLHAIGYIDKEKALERKFNAEAADNEKA